MSLAFIRILRNTEMSSDNPVSDAFEGATKGALDWTAEKVSMANKEILFFRRILN
jgi:hypothetical protein